MHECGEQERETLAGERKSPVLVTHAVVDVLGLEEVTRKEKSGIDMSFFSSQRNGSRWRCVLHS